MSIPPSCRKLFDQFHECLNNASIGAKLLGACTTEQFHMNQCLDQQSEKRRKRNKKKAMAFREKYREAVRAEGYSPKF